MLRGIINGVLGGVLGIASSKIYKWHCNTSKDKLIQNLPRSLTNVFYQCDYEKAIGIDINLRKIILFKLNEDDSIVQEELEFNIIEDISIIEDNNINGDCKYIRLKVLTSSISHPYAEIIFLKPMYLSGGGYFCKDSDMYQTALIEANKCKKILETNVFKALEDNMR